MITSLDQVLVDGGVKAEWILSGLDELRGRERHRVERNIGRATAHKLERGLSREPVFRMERDGIIRVSS